MSGLICLATVGMLIQASALSLSAADPTPPDTDFTLIDDFESYTDDTTHRIFQTWVDGWGIDEPPPGCPGNGTGATVGYIKPPFAEQVIVHNGRQSMPVDYNNIWLPYYSEAERCYYLEGPQDWTVRGMNTLSLWFRGRVDNSREPLYMVLEDSGRRTNDRTADAPV